MRTLAFAKRDTRGYVLPTTMLVVIIATTAIVALVAAVLFSTRFIGSSRDRVQAVAFAEAGVDAAVSYLEVTPGSTWDCGPVDGAALQVPGLASYRYTIEYFSTISASTNELSSPIPCSGGKATGTPAGARITSVGSADLGGSVAQARNSTMQADVRITSSTASGPTLDKGLFGDLGITINTTLTLNAEGSNVPDVYTNKDLTCSSSMNIAGSLYAQGKVTLQSEPCRVQRDLYVRDRVTIPNSSDSTYPYYVGRDLTVSRYIANKGVNESLVINGLPGIVGTAKLGGVAGKAADWWPKQFRTAMGARLSENVTGIPDPPVSTFPQLRAVAADWPGFTWPPKSWRTEMLAVNPLLNVCSWPSTTGAMKSFNTYNVTAPTILDARTDCPSLKIGAPSWPAGATFNLGADLVIFVDSVEFNSGSFKIRSADGAEHSLYIVTPWSTTAPVRTCTTTAAPAKISTTGITWDQGPNTRVLLYTPGTIDVRSALIMRGQVYGCVVSLPTSPLTITYAPVGAGGGGGTSGGQGSVDLIFKRELPN